MENYQILELIGEGAYGKVYKGRRKGVGKLVALKFLPWNVQSHAEMKTALHEEIEILKTLDHPNIIKLLDSFQTPDHLCVVTEYGYGELFEMLEMDGSFSEITIRSIAWQLIQALHYLHHRRILHRDLKPQNILVCGKGVVKLCDFGFARSLSSQTTAVKSIKGTPLYMSPELLLGRPYNHTVDLWSLGVILYELSTGQPCFSSDNFLNLATSIIKDPAKYPSTMSQEFRSLLGGLLEKDPCKRMTYPTLLNHPFFSEKASDSNLVIQNACDDLNLVLDQWNNNNNHCEDGVLRMIDQMKMQRFNSKCVEFCVRVILECQLIEIHRVFKNIVCLLAEQDDNSLKDNTDGHWIRDFFTQLLKRMELEARDEKKKMDNDFLDRMQKVLGALAKELFSTAADQLLVIMHEMQFLKNAINSLPLKDSDHRLSWLWPILLDCLRSTENESFNVHNFPLYLTVARPQKLWPKIDGPLVQDVKDCFENENVREALILGIKDSDVTVLEVLPKFCNLCCNEIQVLLLITTEQCERLPREQEIFNTLLKCPRSALAFGILCNLLPKQGPGCKLDFQTLGHILDQIKEADDFQLRAGLACFFYFWLNVTSYASSNNEQQEFLLFSRRLIGALLRSTEMVHNIWRSREGQYQDKALLLCFAALLLSLEKVVARCASEDVMCGKESRKLLLSIKELILENSEMQYLSKEGIISGLKLLSKLAKQKEKKSRFFACEKVQISFAPFLDSVLNAYKDDAFLDGVLQKTCKIYYSHLQIKNPTFEVLHDACLMKGLLQVLERLKPEFWNLPVYLICKLARLDHLHFLRADGIKYTNKMKTTYCSMFIIETWLLLLFHIAQMRPSPHCDDFEQTTIPFLKDCLSIQHPGIQSKACYLIGALCQYSGHFYATFKMHSIPQRLIQCCGEMDFLTRRAACYALGHTAFHNGDLYEELGASIPLLVHVIHEEVDDKIRSNAAGALGNLVRNSDALCEVMITCEAIPTLLELGLESCESDLANYNAPWTGLFALGNLCTYNLCREEAIHKYGILEKIQLIKCEKMSEVKKRLWKKLHCHI